MAVAVQGGRRACAAKKHGASLGGMAMMTGLDQDSHIGRRGGLQRLLGGVAWIAARVVVRGGFGGAEE